MSDETITLKLTADEGLVLFDLLSRVDDQQQDSGKLIPTLELEHDSEWAALCAVLCNLESQSVEPFAPKYLDLLAASRARLSAGGAVED